MEGCSSSSRWKVREDEKNAGWSKLHWLKLTVTQVECKCLSIKRCVNIDSWSTGTQHVQVLHQLEKQSEQTQRLTNVQPKTTPSYLLRCEFIQPLAGHKSRLHERGLFFNLCGVQTSYVLSFMADFLVLLWRLLGRLQPFFSEWCFHFKIHK